MFELEYENFWGFACLLLCGILHTDNIMHTVLLGIFKHLEMHNKIQKVASAFTALFCVGWACGGKREV